MGSNPTPTAFRSVEHCPVLACRSMPVRFLSRADVQRLLEIEPMLEAVDGALRAIADGRSDVPPRVAARTDDGLLGAMPGYVRDVALGAKLVSVFPKNLATGKPSHQGLIALFDPRDGTPICLMDGLHVTALRTAAATAVAARALARSGSRILAILGSGAQARAHLEVMTAALEFTEVRLAARDPDKAKAIADGRDRPASVAGSFREAVEGADVVCCCTDAHEPILARRWLFTGAHVSSVGSGSELDTATIDSCRLFAEWRGAATEPPTAGAVELQGVDPESVTLVGDVLAGVAPGRISEDEVTVYKSTGHAAEDMAVAATIFERARREDVGVSLEL